jgi:hypothetical protein
MTNYRLKHILGQTVFHIVVILLGFIMLYPILWMVSNSFKENADIFNTSSLIPETFRFDNYGRGWRFNNSVTFSTFFYNSFYYTIISTHWIGNGSSMWWHMDSPGSLPGSLILVRLYVHDHDDSLPGGHGPPIHHFP